ncbi:hypothetical protein [Shimia aestuarii]|uniref:Apea-like HEPN domain-containing protein n=1 Tax=Shimia aestuarii TaxID=254406 RepID=A0A1I4TYW1_9RHOB|nr:hypothetical protein [Shimia aestuarii]SFM81791.1 hypothetical protein SAMN04488042_1263 [Shimia aestuarii]
MAAEHGLKEVQEWLRAGAPQFGEIDQLTQVGITYFVLTWSLFDFQKLGARGRLTDVESFIETSIPEVCDFQIFMPYFEFFKARYLDNMTGNHRLDALCWNDYNSLERITTGLQQLDPDCVTVVGTLLRIAYRLRCNLIHGSKWQYGLEDQRENFAYSSAFMTKIIDRF